MKELSADEQQEIIEHTNRIAAQMKTHKKGKYVFGGSGNSGIIGNSDSIISSVNFSDGASFSNGYVEDSNGVPNLDENFAAERALLDIRRHIIRADLEKTLTGQINARNEITRRNRERKAEFQESLQKNY